DSHTKKPISDRQIEKAVAGRLSRLVQANQMRIESRISLGIIQVALQIAHPIRQPLPGGFVDLVNSELALAADKALHHFGKSVLPFRCALRGKIDTNELELVRQPAGFHQITECRNNETLSQITGGTKNDHCAWWGERCAIRGNFA